MGRATDRGGQMQKAFSCTVFACGFIEVNIIGVCGGWSGFFFFWYWPCGVGYIMGPRGVVLSAMCTMLIK